MNTKTLIKISALYIIVILLAAWGISAMGCGGSSPVAEEAIPSQTPPLSKIEVEIEVANQTVKAGEMVRLTAKVQTTPPGTKILYSWAVVDGEGALANADQSTVPSPGGAYFYPHFFIFAPVLGLYRLSFEMRLLVEGKMRTNSV